MKRKLNIKKLPMILGLLITIPLMASKPGFAGTEPFMGELMLIGNDYCPRGWMNADGQVLEIAQYTALFSLYGTRYGGDGRTTFSIPDLRGRAPIHEGIGPGLANYQMASRGGTEMLTISTTNMPSHNHNVQATNAIANKNGPGTDLLAITALDQDIYHNGPADKLMDPSMITNTGGGAPMQKRSPYLTMRWCVATQGAYPARQ